MICSVKTSPSKKLCNEARSLEYCRGFFLSWQHCLQIKFCYKRHLVTSDELIKQLKESGPENESREDFQKRVAATLQDGEALTSLGIQDDSNGVIEETLSRIASGDF